MCNRKPFSRQNTCLVAVALLALFTLAVPSTATADTIETFDVTGSFPLPGATFTGGGLQNFPGVPSFVTIDTTTGAITGGALFLTSGNEVFCNVPILGCSSEGNDYRINFNNPGGFTGFTGGPIPESVYNIDSLVVFSENVVFTPVPEPASTCMLGIGLLSLMGLILLRKRVA